ncbi:MFS transporter [Streptomyces sp. NPDC004134]|uniref:MFS transporter n=1 Tax=Streptomyces sp. NPDC004134 TaxID=3364691 RepID=UPI0036BAD885
MSETPDTAPPSAKSDGTPPGNNVFAVLRRLPARARVLLLADVVNAFGIGVVMPFLVIYLSEVRDINIRIAAGALAVSAVAAFASGLAWGAALDRYRHRIIMPTVMVLAAVGTGLYAFADRPWIAITAALIVGLAQGGIGPVIRTMFATAVPAHERTVFFGLQFGIFNGAVGLGVLLGGALVNGSVERYQTLYIIDGITFLLMAVVLLIATSDSGKRQAKDEDGGEEVPKPSYRTVLRTPVVMLIIATMSLAAVFYYGLFESVLPGYLTINDAVSARGVSGAFVINVVVVVLAQFVVMPRLGKVRRTTWLGAAGLLWGVSWLLVLLAGRTDGTAALVLLFVSSVPFAAAEVMVTPVLAALLNDVVDDRVRGRANALFAFAITGGSILGPAMAAAMLPVGKGVPLVAGLAVGCLLMLIPTAVLRKRLGSERDTPSEGEDAKAESPEAGPTGTGASGADAAEPGSAEPAAPAPTASM